MTLLTSFMVLIARCVRGARTALLVALAAALGLPLGQLASAAPGQGPKLSRDLQAAIDAPSTPKARWARDRNGQRLVQVVFVSTENDPNLPGLRKVIAQAGGSVDAHMPGLRMLTSTLPASRVKGVSERADIKFIAPNRDTRRTASTLEAITGTTTTGVRTSSTKTSYSGLDGSGIGIAIVDSGVMKAHAGFNNGSGVSRVLKNVQFLTTSQSDWTDAYSINTSLEPGSAALASYEAAINNSASLTQDGYGHGTHVASVAAGRPVSYSTAPDLTGIAPNANLYDVKVLNDLGFGTLSDVLEGIQWVIYHAKEYNIRVINLSLAMDSTDSWQDDPLCAAARSAVSVGITVVAAAGNFGKTLLGKEQYGSISSPGNDPSVITVGSANYKATTARADDVVNLFSSRGPTGGGRYDYNGNRQSDNLLKPDLVAPGNQIVGAMATKADAAAPTRNLLATLFPQQLVTATGITQVYRETQMYLSGTSVSAPVVAGAAALLLQTNPGLTPAMVKAILQYTAQPIAGANLVQQGAGLLNVNGAVTLAKVLRTDVASAIQAGTIAAGANLLASGKAMPTTRSSTIGGATANWSRVVFIGGNRVATGDALFTKFQPFYDPRISWARSTVLQRYPDYWDSNRTYVYWFWEYPMTDQALVTAGVVDGTSLLGVSSLSAKTGGFTPTATLASWFASGSGVVLGSGIVMSEGIVMAEGIVMSEGIVMAEGIVMSEGVVMAEGVVMSEGNVGAESTVLSEP